MVDLAETWREVLPEVRKGVTGVGVWQALNACRPITLDEGTLVMGVPFEVSELAGHLRIPLTKRLIEQHMGSKLGREVVLRVIEGLELDDWLTVKRRDEEAKRLQRQAMEKVRQEASARASWEATFDALARKHASIPNKSLPQNRAKFFHEAVALIAETWREMPKDDELAERNYARCLERVAQYTELPSTFVALKVMELVSEG